MLAAILVAAAARAAAQNFPILDVAAVPFLRDAAAREAYQAFLTANLPAAPRGLTFRSRDLVRGAAPARSNRSGARRLMPANSTQGRIARSMPRTWTWSGNGRRARRRRRPRRRSSPACNYSFVPDAALSSGTARRRRRASLFGRTGRARTRQPTSAGCSRSRMCGCSTMRASTWSGSTAIPPPDEPDRGPAVAARRPRRAAPHAATAGSSPAGESRGGVEQPADAGHARPRGRGDRHLAGRAWLRGQPNLLGQTDDFRRLLDEAAAHRRRRLRPVRRRPLYRRPRGEAASARHASGKVAALLLIDRPQVSSATAGGGARSNTRYGRLPASLRHRCAKPAFSLLSGE